MSFGVLFGSFHTRLTGHFCGFLSCVQIWDELWGFWPIQILENLGTMSLKKCVSIVFVCSSPFSESVFRLQHGHFPLAFKLRFGLLIWGVWLCVLPQLWKWFSNPWNSNNEQLLWIYTYFILQYTICELPTLIQKFYVFSGFCGSYLSLNVDKSVHFMQRSTKMTYIFPILCINFKSCYNLWSFICIYKVKKISINLRKLESNFFSSLLLFHGREIYY